MGESRISMVLAAAAVVLVGCGNGDDRDVGGYKDEYLDNAIPGIYTNSGLVDYEFDEESITIELDEGSKDDPNVCNTSLDPAEVGDRTLTLVFPDGEVDCTDALQN